MFVQKLSSKPESKEIKVFINADGYMHISNEDNEVIEFDPKQANQLREILQDQQTMFKDPLFKE